VIRSHHHASKLLGSYLQPYLHHRSNHPSDIISGTPNC
jgi:hypothetical protein